jgi:hypothetical protein
MSKHNGKKNFWLALLASSLLITAWAVFSGAYTRAQSKPTLDDALIREGRDGRESVRAKSGFKLVVVSEDTISVRRLEKETEIGKVKCGVCPGGRCRARLIIDRGTCKGCGSNSASDCTFDPF